MRADADRVADCLEAIDAIRSKFPASRKDYDDDEMLHVWCKYHIAVMGEACAQMSNAVKQAFPDIPWKDVIGMRHIMIHSYHKVDLDILWRTVTQKLPSFHEQLLEVERWLAENDEL